MHLLTASEIPSVLLTGDIFQLYILFFDFTLLQEKKSESSMDSYNNSDFDMPDQDSGQDMHQAVWHSR